MRYCINCGAQLRDDAELCGTCGVNQTVVPEGGHGQRGANEKYCVECGVLINRRAEICPECGVRQTSPGGAGDMDSDQMAAALLAIFVGGIGVHKFYQGRTKLGVIYLCFSWTLIPALIAFVEGILMLVADEEEYQRKYADGSVLGM